MIKNMYNIFNNNYYDYFYINAFNILVTIF